MGERKERERAEGQERRYIENRRALLFHYGEIISLQKLYYNNSIISNLYTTRNIYCIKRMK